MIGLSFLSFLLQLLYITISFKFMFRLSQIFIFISLALILNAQNESYIKQMNGFYSEVNIIQIGDNNVLTGISELNVIVEDAIGDIHNAAFQYSQTGGFNQLNVEQTESTFTNLIFLHQVASKNNYGNFSQHQGSHIIRLQEFSYNGSNESYVSQLNGSGFINLEREAFLNNTIPSSANTQMNNYSGYDGIHQEGHLNVIAGASEINIPFIGPQPVFRMDLPAKQIAQSGSNWMEVWQTGNFNRVGLYQEAFTDNTALIKQENGYNLTVAIQKNTGGANYLEVEQSGGMTARIHQISGKGLNRAVIKQY